jgi:hypothetical protein
VTVREKATRAVHVAELSDDALVKQLREELRWRMKHREGYGYNFSGNITGGHTLLVYLSHEYMRRHGD